MIRIDSMPLGYISLSGALGYLSAKFAVKAAYVALKVLFGSDTFTERWLKAADRLSEGKFSWLRIVVGEDSWRSRIQSLSSFGSYTASSFALGLFSYTFYWLSTQERKIDFSHYQPCMEGLEGYKREKQLAWDKQTYWKQSVCQLEQEQWSITLPKVEACYSNVYSWGFQNSYMQSYCEDLFNEETFKEANRNYILRDRVGEAHLSLLDHKDKVKTSCSRHLSEVDKAVNKACSSLYPFININSGLMCRGLKWSGVDVNEGCLSACKIYEEQVHEVFDEIDDPLPSTKDLTLNCTAILENVRHDFTDEVRAKDFLIDASSALLSYLGRQQDTYKGYWKKGLFKTWNYNQQEQSRVSASSLFENDQLSSEEKSFFSRFFRYRRLLIQNFEEKWNLKKTIQAQALQNSTETLERARQIYMT